MRLDSDGSRLITTTGLTIQVAGLGLLAGSRTMLPHGFVAVRKTAATTAVLSGDIV